VGEEDEEDEEGLPSGDTPGLEVVVLSAGCTSFFDMISSKMRLFHSSKRLLRIMLNNWWHVMLTLSFSQLFFCLAIGLFVRLEDKLYFFYLCPSNRSRKLT